MFPSPNFTSYNEEIWIKIHLDPSTPYEFKLIPPGEVKLRSNKNNKDINAFILLRKLAQENFNLSCESNGFNKLNNNVVSFLISMNWKAANEQFKNLFKEYTCMVNELRPKQKTYSFRHVNFP
ncbi:hypothetical protein Glove_481g12 [Diversispora epigaea]|uniref:Uncharacterized protein n=1 Tax=Diversispora epigaea TaxID=1348612 RepID=A0A397GL32_9GLOM|nr:hypothetical protein Glove_481g12 [Diversispora epigaea]